ncbi:MAG TPA: tetratricopeptide repeat protein [Casimicrobiaceae bacterium]|nr:tetratricopeptide repeat protein [Casimicrobiaceae bacterium]
MGERTKIAVAMQGFWILTGRSIESRDYIRVVLTLPAVQAHDVALGHALYVGAALATSQGDYAEACRMLERCLLLRRGLGNEFDIAAALSALAEALVHTGKPAEAREREEEALAIFRRLEDRRGEAIGHQHLGHICLYEGDHVQARDHLEQSLASRTRSSIWSSKASASACLVRVHWRRATRPKRRAASTARLRCAATPVTVAVKRWRCGGWATWIS